MERKRIIVDQNEWAIDESAGQDVTDLVKTAMANSTVVDLAVLDGANRRVTYLFNGRTANVVIVDLDLGSPKPSEISG